MRIQRKIQRKATNYVLNYVDTVQAMTYNYRRMINHGRVAEVCAFSHGDMCFLSLYSDVRCMMPDIHEKGETWKNTIQVRFPNPPGSPAL